MHFNRSTHRLTDFSLWANALLAFNYLRWNPSDTSDKFVDCSKDISFYCLFSCKWIRYNSGLYLHCVSTWHKISHICHIRLSDLGINKFYCLENCGIDDGRKSRFGKDKISTTSISIQNRPCTQITLIDIVDSFAKPAPDPDSVYHPVVVEELRQRSITSNRFLTRVTRSTFMVD